MSQTLPSTGLFLTSANGQAGRGKEMAGLGLNGAAFMELQEGVQVSVCNELDMQ